MAYAFADAPGPRLAAPAGATDTHMHIYEPGYPMAPTALMPPLDGPLVDYRQLQQRLGLDRVVIVQPSTYGLDNRCTMEAVAKLGGAARAVVCVGPDITDDALAALSEQGARGIRFFMLPGGPLAWDVLDEMAFRTQAFGWHVQLQLDGRDLPDRMDRLIALSSRLVIDHVGKFLEPVTVDDPAFKALQRLVDGGAYVKLSAPYETSRVGPPYYDDVGALAKALVEQAPERMLWATNWPHPAQDPRPDDAVVLDMLLDWVPDETVRNRILVDNPARVYGF